MVRKTQNMYQEKSILVSVLIFLIFRFRTCIDTITLTRPVNDNDGDILVPSVENFALGFFSPANSTNRYVGIWYNKVSEQTVVWVFNRDQPITNSSCILSVDETGNLLLDSGNLVLFQGLVNKEVYSWQSFNHPSNTLLPDMKFGLDKKTGLNRVVTSWKSTGNPGVGDYSCKLEFVGSPQFFLFHGMTKVWRTGPWTGLRWSGIPEMDGKDLYNVTYTNNNDDVVIVYQMHNSTIFSRIVVTESGTMDRLTWQEADRKWLRSVGSK
ncbi:putative S-locus glycoprotein [Helianthus anomalus]